ncbi:HNH endonuclease, partial [uncultured Gordonia sp.]
LSCDTTITKIILNTDGVPLDVGRQERLFTPGQRKALLVRDRGCIKCGAHAGRCQAHHAHHWADGGPTDLDNGCLLCSSCHDDVHHHGWDIIMGFDRHPWLIPPASVDPKRRPIPSYHRRTMRLDDAAA